MSDESQTVLLVDSDEMDRFALQQKLSRKGYNVVSLDKGEDALYLLRSGDVKVDLIISDVKLRKMDGIELLRRIKSMDEPLPMLLITGQGNMEDVITALRLGADDFIRKPFDANDVLSSVHSVLRRKQEKSIAESFARFLEYAKAIYVIPNDISLINIMAFQLTSTLAPSGFCTNAVSENLSLALKEALTNAVCHGNLEISSDIRESEGLTGFNGEIDRRSKMPIYRDRKVKIIYEQTSSYVDYSIEDEGKGFDYKNQPDPRNPENFFKNSGRGLLIIGVHFDEVSWNDKGNRIFLKKYKPPAQNIKNGLLA